MSIGSIRARSGGRASHPCVVSRKALSLLIAFALAVSMTPSAAWAATGDGSPARGATDDVAAATVEALPVAQSDGGEGSGARAAEGEGESHAVSLDGVAATGSSQDDSSQNEDAAAEPDSAQNAQASEQAFADGATPAAVDAAEASNDKDRATESSEASPDSSSVAVTCSVIGADANGNEQVWAALESYTLERGANAADLTEALFERHDIVAGRSMGPYGFYLETITSPFDADVTLGYEASSGKYWQLFVNGVPSDVAADAVSLQSGDSVVWYYSCWGSAAPVGQVSASCKVIGLDANGNAQVWIPEKSYAMVEGATAADLSEQVFSVSGLESTVEYGPWGFHLKEIVSPFDGRALSEESTAPYQYWQLFVNGSSSDVGAGDYELCQGDSIVWCYSTYGSALPDSDEIVVDPSASRPSFDSSWPGFANGLAGGTVSNRPTPTESAELSWAYNYKGDEAFPCVSDPLIVNGDVYLVVSGELRVIDAATGAVKVANGKELRAKLGAMNGYYCRPVYSEGIVVVPLDNGSLVAFSADTLTCVWKTPPLSTEGSSLNYQALSSLTVSNGCVYAGFTMVGAGFTGTAGAMICVRLSDGSTVWSKTHRADEGGAAGYYWAGGAVSGSDIVIGDESGVVSLIDGSTGSVKSTVSVGAKCRSSVIPVSGEENAYLVVSYDGVLHKIVRSGDGLTVSGKVSFASYATSTPAVSNGKAFVCSRDAEGYGTLFIIDLATMAVEKAVRAGEGASQSAPLVSVQGDGTYVYFTCNAMPGAVYGYKVGSDAAYKLYEPDAGKQNYCTASVIADEKGNLYYTNDSGHLFALAAKPGVQVSFDSRGGSYVASCYVALGGTLVKPVDPTRAGYAFGGWFSDAGCEVPWDFSMPLNEGRTLYAKWIANASGGSSSAGKPGGGSGAVGSGGGLAAGGSGSAVPGAGGGAGLLGGGYVAAAHAPLAAAQAAGQTVPANAAEGDADAEAAGDADGANADAAFARARSGAADAARSGDAAAATSGLGGEGDADAARELNPAALAALLAGLAGLGGALWFLLGRRRADDGEDEREGTRA